MAKTFKAVIRDARRHDVYWEQWPINDFAEELVRRMESVGLSRSALATKLGVSPPYITKVLRGDVNLTIRSLAKIARAVDSVVRMHLAPENHVTMWLDSVDGRGGVVDAANGSARVAFSEPVEHSLKASALAVGTGNA